MKEAIQKAIEGGWRPTFNSLPHLHPNREWQHITSDPLFWQSLGKALGWSGTNTACNKCGVAFNGWKGHWHRFIDHIAEGKDVDEFFKELIK